jgi:hypothetical protein
VQVLFFYNPAGLSYIPREYGIEVELINLSISTNKNVLDFATDMQDATDNPPQVTGDEDTDETLAVIDVIDEYTGDNMHFDFNNYTSISKKGEKIGFAVGAYVGANLDFKTHRPLHRVLEVEGLIFGPSAVLGMSYDFEDVELFKKYELNKFSLGFGVKQMNYYSLSHEFSIAELIEHKDDMDDYIVDDLAKQGSSTVFDIGGIYELTNIAPNFQVGVSVLNIGGVGDKDVLYIPSTVNMGVAYLKRWKEDKFFNQVRFAADLVDATYQYDQDDDLYKRTRLGVEANIWDGWFSTFTPRVGLYQGSVTYGFNLRLAFIQLAYAKYSEEIGAYNGQDKDERQTLNLTIGW